MSDKVSNFPTIKAYFELYFLYSVFPRRVENSTVGKHAFFSTPASNFHVDALSWHGVNSKAKRQVFGQRLAVEPIRFLDFVLDGPGPRMKNGPTRAQACHCGNSVPGLATVAWSQGLEFLNRDFISKLLYSKTCVWKPMQAWYAFEDVSLPGILK